MDALLYRRIVRRVVLPLAALIVLSSIDRVNVGFAAVRMNGDLGLTPTMYGLGVGIFFAGYLLFQLPSAWLLQRIGARAWIALTVIGWGISAAALGVVRGAADFYALRFLLGVFEGGFAPGMVWYVSQWLPQAYRARAIALTLFAIPVSVIVGGPLCGVLLSLHTHVPAWRVMFFAEGTATVLAGAAAWFWFVDGPGEARWLDPVERDGIAAALAAEHAAPRTAARAPMRWGDPVLWLSALIWLVLITGSNAIIFWLPIAIRALGHADPLAIGVLRATPWVAIGIGMLANARHSDRTQERFRHLAWPMAWAAMMLAGAAAAIPHGLPALALLVFAGLGIGGAQSVFWTVPTRLLGRQGPTPIAVINLVGNASGAVAPVAIGAMVQRTGAVTLPAYVLAALLLAGAALVPPLRRAAESR